MPKDKSNRLLFKGEKKPKKHKRKHADLDGLDDDGPIVVASGAPAIQEETWLNPPSQDLILGPLYIICIEPSASAYSSTTSEGPTPCTVAIFPTPISPIAKVGPAALSSSALETLEPDNVNHVFVCARVLDSPDKVTLRAANGRYLAATSVGEVNAEQEARGMQEEWVFEKIGEEDDEAEAEGKGKSKSVAKASDGIFALRSAAYSTFLSVDETAGGKLELRCDSTSPSDPANRFLVRMQTEQLATAKRRREEEQAKRGLGGKKGDDGIVIMKPGESFGDLEERLIRQSQARGAGRLVSSTESASALKKARKEGRLAEEMLDRRSKLKSDRYAR